MMISGRQLKLCSCCLARAQATVNATFKH